MHVAPELMAVCKEEIVTMERTMVLFDIPYILRVCIKANPNHDPSG